MTETPRKRRKRKARRKRAKAKPVNIPVDGAELQRQQNINLYGIAYVREDQ